ncbi:hypothetical protein CLU79DRAFT_248978 [Phycomyces nitens]|nr:hypothetical protein CLU79DRAFT_248978 [Phycomyces nitens]
MAAIGPTVQPPLDFAAQNDQLWKIIEKQRLIIQNLQKSLAKVTTERDNLLKRPQDPDLNDLPGTNIPDNVNRHPINNNNSNNNNNNNNNLERSLLSPSSEFLQPNVSSESSETIPLGPVPPPRSPYRQNSSKDVNNSTILQPNTPISYNSTASSDSNYRLAHDKDPQPLPVNRPHTNRPAPLKLTPSHTASSSYPPHTSFHAKEKSSQDNYHTPRTAGFEHSHSIGSVQYNCFGEDETSHDDVLHDKGFSPKNEENEGLDVHAHDKQVLSQGQKPNRPARVRQDHSANSVRTLVDQELAAYALPSQPSFTNLEMHDAIRPTASIDEVRFPNIQQELKRDFDEDTLVGNSEIVLSPTAMPITKPLPKNPFFSNMAGISVKVVESSIKSNEKGKEEVYFTIAVIKSSDSLDRISEELWRVEKRHSDILALDYQLKLQVRSVGQKIAKLPDKALFSTHAPNKVDQRKLAIEKYLQHAINLPFNDSTSLCEFLSTNVVNDQPRPIHPRGHKYGYLTKRGKNFGGWKTRYFSLEGPELQYYDGKEGPLLGTIKLFNAQIGRQTSVPQGGTDSSTDSRSFRHAFLILEPRKGAPNGFHRHVLCASSDSERDQWVEALARYVNQQKPSSEDENTKRINHQKLSKKGDKSRKARSSDTIAPDNRKPSYLPRSSSDTTLHPSDLMASDISDISTLASIREKDIQALRDRSSAEHVLFGKRQQFSKRNSISFPPREGTDSIFRNSDYLSQINTTFDGSSPKPSGGLGADGSVEPDAKKAKQMLNRRTFWGKKIFSSSTSEIQNDNLGITAITSASTSSSTANSYTQSGGLRGLLSRNSSDIAERSIPENKTSSTETLSKPLRHVFGVSLEEAVRVSRISEKYELPAIAYRCIEYLEAKNAFEEEGIYRLSGSAVKIKSLKDQFNKGDIRLLDSEEYYDLHAVAGLLKMWLRELTGNILTSELMNDFMLVIDVIDHTERATELGRLVSLLPLANYTLLRTLSAHLIRVVQNAEINKMNMRNIGIVFSATLGIPSGIFNLLLSEFSYVFWTKSEDKSSTAIDKDDNKCITSLYQQNQEIYGLSLTKPESSLTKDVSKLQISQSTSNKTNRNSRNSLSYMDGAPQNIVGLEALIETVGPLQVGKSDFCLDMSDFEYNENNGAPQSTFDFFKDVVEAGFPNSA